MVDATRKVPKKGKQWTPRHAIQNRYQQVQHVTKHTHGNQNSINHQNI